MALEDVVAAVARLSGAVDQVEHLCDENRRLRALVWSTHICTRTHSSMCLYGDDGEMQCSICLLDFRRTPIDEIEMRLQLLALERMQSGPQRDTTSKWLVDAALATQAQVSS